MVSPITLKQSSFSKLKNTFLIFATYLCSQKSIKCIKLKVSRCLKPVTFMARTCIILKDSVSYRTITSQIWKRTERSSSLNQTENSLHSISQGVLPLPQPGEDGAYHLERQTIPLRNGCKGQKKSKGSNRPSHNSYHWSPLWNKSIPPPIDPFQIS